MFNFTQIAPDNSAEMEAQDNRQLSKDRRFFLNYYWKAVQEDWHFAKDLKGRLGNIVNHMKDRPGKIFHILIGAAFLEIVRLKGKRAFLKNKDQQTWQPIASTKQ